MGKQHLIIFNRHHRAFAPLVIHRLLFFLSRQQTFKPFFCHLTSDSSCQMTNKSDILAEWERNIFVINKHHYTWTLFPLATHWPPLHNTFGHLSFATLPIFLQWTKLPSTRELNASRKKKRRKHHSVILNRHHSRAFSVPSMLPVTSSRNKTSPAFFCQPTFCCNWGFTRTNSTTPVVLSPQEYMDNRTREVHYEMILIRQNQVSSSRHQTSHSSFAILHFLSLCVLLIFCCWYFI